MSPSSPPPRQQDSLRGRLQEANAKLHMKIVFEGVARQTAENDVRDISWIQVLCACELGDRSWG